MRRRNWKVADRHAAEVERRVAEALGQSEPGTLSAASVSVHVWDDGRPPRYPAVGLHPGAIEGTVPHRCRLVRHG